MFQSVYIVAYPPLPARSGHVLRLKAIWESLMRLGPTKLIVLGPKPSLEIRRQLMQSGAVILPQRKESFPAKQIRHARAFLLGKSMFCAKAISDKRLERIKREAHAYQPDVIVLGETALADLVPALRDCQAAVIVDAHNVDSDLYYQHFRAASGLEKLKQWFIWKNFEVLEDYLRLADHVLAVSHKDADVYRRKLGIDHISVVPNGIDIASYVSATSNVARLHRSLVFTGNFGYLPNEQAALDLIDVSRRLLQKGISHETILAGRSPSPRMHHAALGAPHITITGLVDDIRPILASAALAVVPLSFGGGTKFKVIEAMILGHPVITTPVGAEGLDAEDGREIVVVRNVHEFEDAVASLLADPNRAEQIGRAGQRWAQARYGYEAVEAALRKAFALALSGK